MNEPHIVRTKDGVSVGTISHVFMLHVLSELESNVDYKITKIKFTDGEKTVALILNEGFKVGGTDSIELIFHKHDYIEID